MVRTSAGIKWFLILLTMMLSAVTMNPSLPIIFHVKDIQNDSVHRIERSTNYSRITGTGRKIQMYIKDKYLQLFNDGTVNATDNEDSDYTILQRTSVNADGQVKIMGVATCTYLCMDPCGLLYSTREFNDECIFNERLEQHYYNTYSSTKYSDHKHTLFVAISKKGTPRNVHVRVNSALGKFSSCTNVLPQPVDHERLVQLENTLMTQNKNESHHNLRHHQLCPPPHNTKITMSLICHDKKKKNGNKNKFEEEESKDTSEVSENKPTKKKVHEGFGHKKNKISKTKLIHKLNPAHHAKETQSFTQKVPRLYVDDNSDEGY